MAQNQVAIGEQALVNAEAAVAQQQLELANMLSRTGAGDPALADIPIVPVDQLAIPAADDLPSVGSLVQKALAPSP